MDEGGYKSCRGLTISLQRRWRHSPKSPSTDFWHLISLVAEAVGKGLGKELGPSS